MEHTQPKHRPLAIWNPVTDRWEREQETIFGHSDAYSETWPTSGMTVNGVAYELPTWEHHTAGTGYSSSQHDAMLPTPTTSEATGAGRSEKKTGGDNLRTTVTLLPTPVAQPSGNTPENHLRKKPGRQVVTDLSILVENDLIKTGGKLLPTPKAGDGEMHTPMTSGRPVEKSTHLGTIAMLQAGHLEHRRTGESTRLQLPDGRPVEEPALPLQS